jgi:15-cis-phytoene synthase
VSASAGHCFALVRDADKDRFLASLFAPGDKRPALLALYAFNIEIARVRGLVSEPRIGEIRYQWWRDTIDGIYSGTTSPHPVAEELARAVELGELPKQPLLDLIAAREFDLYDDPMPDLATLEGYLGETSSALIQMASLVLAGRAAQGSAEVAGLAGVAQGIAGLLRDRWQAYLPKDMDAAAAVAHARARLAEARALRHKIPHAARAAFLPVSLTDLYLDRASRRGGTSAIEISQFRRQWRMWMAARREVF